MQTLWACLSDASSGPSLVVCLSMVRGGERWTTSLLSCTANRASWRWRRLAGYDGWGLHGWEAAVRDWASWRIIVVRAMTHLRALSWAVQQGTERGSKPKHKTESIIKYRILMDIADLSVSVSNPKLILSSTYWRLEALCSLFIYLFSYLFIYLLVCLVSSLLYVLFCYYDYLQGFTLHLKTAGPLPESVLTKAKIVVWCLKSLMILESIDFGSRPNHKRKRCSNYLNSLFCTT